MNLRSRYIIIMLKSLSSLQIVTGLTQSAYEEEKAVCDLTIQHTVVDIILGTTVDQVTDIIVEGISDSDQTNSLTRAPVPQCSLKYKVQASDASVTLDTVEAQLINAIQSGKMDESLHHYDIVFSATSLVNCTLSAPLITNEDQESDSDSPKKGKMVGLLLVYKIQLYHQVELNAARQKLSKPKCEVEV